MGGAVSAIPSVVARRSPLRARASARLYPCRTTGEVPALADQLNDRVQPVCPARTTGINHVIRCCD